MDDKKKQLLNKLKALAERGVGGEKETVQRKLKELMKKYGVEEADLSDEKRKTLNLNIRINLKNS